LFVARSTFDFRSTIPGPVQCPILGSHITGLIGGCTVSESFAPRDNRPVATNTPRSTPLGGQYFSYGDGYNHSACGGITWSLTRTTPPAPKLEPRPATITLAIGGCCATLSLYPDPQETVPLLQVTASCSSQSLIFPATKGRTFTIDLRGYTETSYAPCGTSNTITTYSPITVDENIVVDKTGSPPPCQYPCCC
jgi:hypothetical protein